MTHPIHRVTHVEVVGPYTLSVSFADGAERRIDFRPVLHGPIYGPLQDLATFNAVAIDAEAGTLTWRNGADFDPATLHDWPLVAEEFAALARTWVDSSPNHTRANTRMEPTRR